MFFLAVRNISRRLGQSVVTGLIILVSVLVVTAAFTVVASLEGSIATSRERLGADIMVLPASAASNATEVLFTAQPVNVYLPEESTDAVRGVPGVARATPQFFTQTVDQSCCSIVGVTRIVGVDLPTDFVLTPWIAGDGVTGLGPDGILLGAEAPAIEGGQASILGSVFHAVGTLEETGTSVDETIFMDMDVARDIAQASPYLESIWGDEDPHRFVSCVMVSVSSGADVDDVREAIVAAVPGSVAVATSETISGVSSQLRVLETVCVALLALLVLMAAIALAGRFSALVGGRLRELGLMRTMGVSPTGIVGSLLAETGLVTLVGAVAGTALGCGVSYMLVDYMHGSLSLPRAALGADVYALAVGAGLLFAVALNVLCLLRPALRVVRVDPQTTLTRGDLQ